MLHPLRVKEEIVFFKNHSKIPNYLFHLNNNFIRNNSFQVLMVTGGLTGSDNLEIIDTTETLASDDGTWATAGAKLPQPMTGLRATNIDGSVLIFGNFT